MTYRPTCNVIIFTIIEFVKSILFKTQNVLSQNVCSGANTNVLLCVRYVYICMYIFIYHIINIILIRIIVITYYIIFTRQNVIHVYGLRRDIYEIVL